MIRSVLTLRAKAGQADALERLYAERGVIPRALDFAGCRDAVLLRTSSDGAHDIPAGAVTHLVIADWDAASDYHRWVSDPWRTEVSLELAALLDTDPDAPVVGGLFEFVPPSASS